MPSRIQAWLFLGTRLGTELWAQCSLGTVSSCMDSGCLVCKWPQTFPFPLLAPMVLIVAGWERELVSRYLLCYCLSTWLGFVIILKLGVVMEFALLYYVLVLKNWLLYTTYSWILIFIQSSNFCLLFEDLLCLHCYNYPYYYIRSTMLLFVPAVLFLCSTFFALLWVKLFLLFNFTSTN